ncbi:DUF962 domain-containing protein [Serratia marcescens]|uniref:Mpo1-like protein n=1 Tax=Serratia marcescens TaxID=615 RepID=UPI001F155218|nr:Mpo1-like protein [Serratia marcescens]MDP8608058.1 DUF962 domain-containing protein [Serratia marcescens]MDP8613150.1 DUF962 domain-containing protein [Serratia marcescens]MDP8643204.1 DUF962 domain-containing protein [Serratia marcescens]MDP8653139.1 DUF962 domain-containing protein [Serratia marcescens]MDP8658102.1 DUF962 domain-containing protein [Serratia marcescens]
MRSLEDQLAAYAAYHRDVRNIATHFIGIPLIVVSLLARYPAQQADMTYLLAHAVGEANDAAFADRMMDFLAWMEGQR